VNQRKIEICLENSSFVFDMRLTTLNKHLVESNNSFMENVGERIGQANLQSRFFNPNFLSEYERLSS
jgi:hypothetical protein